MNEINIEQLIMTIGEQTLELRFLRMENATLKKQIEDLSQKEEKK